MESNQSNLLSFLTKQALFNDSPSKARGRRSSRSRSKDRSQDLSSTNSNQWNNSNSNNKNILNQLSSQKVQNSPIKQTFSDVYAGDKNHQFEQPGQKNALWPTLVSYPTSFEAARHEALKILQKLSDQLKGEVRSINIKIQNFNSEMLKVVTSEYKAFRQKLLKIMDEIFKDSQKYINEYIKAQEEKLAKDVILMRNFMESEYSNIEKMKIQINKPNWRKPTGEIVASQLEQKVTDIINKSHELQIGKWDSGDILGYRVRDFEKNLGDVLRLKR